MTLEHLPMFLGVLVLMFGAVTLTRERPIQVRGCPFCGSTVLVNVLRTWYRCMTCKQDFYEQRPE